MSTELIALLISLAVVNLIGLSLIWYIKNYKKGTLPFIAAKRNRLLDLP